MTRSKKLIIGTVLIAVLLFGSLGGLALANDGDDDPQPRVDFLEKLAPHEPISHYRHNRTGEDNGDAHIKRTIMGREVVVAVTKGMLDFGPWEQIYYAEFDGRRPKRILVKIIGE